MKSKILDLKKICNPSKNLLKTKKIFAPKMSKIHEKRNNKKTNFIQKNFSGKKIILFFEKSIFPLCQYSFHSFRIFIFLLSSFQWKKKHQGSDFENCFSAFFWKNNHYVLAISPTPKLARFFGFFLN